MKHPAEKSTTPFQRVIGKTYTKHIPFIAHFELTYRCNLACVHCYATNRRGWGELSCRAITAILDQLAEANCLFLCLTGGEILVRPDIVRILQAARERGFAMRILTNGTLMTDRLADAVAGVRPLSVEMSLYAMRPSVHDRITGVPGSHAKTLAAFRRCRERGINTAVKTVFLKYNAGEYKALADYAKQTKSRFVFDYLLSPSDDGGRPMDIHGLSEDEICGFLLKTAGPAERRRAKRALKQVAAPIVSEPVCGMGCNTLAITPSGDVLPCLAVRQSIGSLLQRRLKDIWNDSALDRIRNARYSDLEDCKGCDWFAYCARCPGVALAECGNMFGRSVSACRAARAAARAQAELKKRQRTHGY